MLDSHRILKESGVNVTDLDRMVSSPAFEQLVVHSMAATMARHDLDSSGMDAIRKFVDVMVNLPKPVPASPKFPDKKLRHDFDRKSAASTATPQLQPKV